MDTSTSSTTHGKEQIANLQKNISNIKNKKRRIEAYVALKKEKNKEKRITRKKRQKEAKALGDDAPPKQIPKTLENTRESDITMVDPEDDEVKIDVASDEMSSYFRKESAPKVLITSADNPHTKTISFCKELRLTIPNSEFKRRKNSSIKTTVKQCIEKEYTDLIIVNEDKRNPNGFLLIHLPDGPTAYFKISNFKPIGKIKSSASFSHHRPEVILNNFSTRLGHTVGRMLASIFHYDPEFRGRRVVTFHNQRDYIFFRQHRYEFRDEKRAGLHEMGPQFTLRLKSLQKGTFDSKYGEYEWVLKRHEMETSRRRFFL